jgi:Reverse transcriptase (RNA-dependent DNA polymerase)
MGFKKAPAIFQMAIEETQGTIIDNGCMVYIDDIIVYGRTKQEHDRNFEEVLARLDERGVKVNKKKFVYGQEEIEYLGFLISQDRIRPKYNEKDSIENHPQPKNGNELQRFLGLMNYYRRFINGFARIAEPL